MEMGVEVFIQQSQLLMFLVVVCKAAVGDQWEGGILWIFVRIFLLYGGSMGVYREHME